jgi:hypothetical protein
MFLRGQIRLGGSVGPKLAAFRKFVDKYHNCPDEFASTDRVDVVGSREDAPST